MVVAAHSFREALQLPTEVRMDAQVHATDPVPWMQSNFRTQVPGGLILLEPVQAAILRFMFQPATEHGRVFRFRDLHWSCPKKSGKTAIAAAVGQWAADDDAVWGRFGEVYCMANDLEQAAGRTYGAIRHSVVQDPGYVARWAEGERRIENHRTRTTIVPRSGEYRGAAGGNPSLTLWSELWGYIHERSRRLWEEMKPSPARRVSVRFVETYRGFEGESELLRDRENVVLEHGRQITAGELSEVTGAPLGVFAEAPNPDSLVPIWVNDTAGMCAYLDTGDIARRMPWQTDASGLAYYREEAANNRPQDYDRHHRNLWAESVDTAIPIEWWDACLDPVPIAPGDRTALVVGMDAGVSHDAFALQGVSRHPGSPDHIAQRLAKTFTPTAGHPVVFENPDAPDDPNTVAGVIRAWARDYNVSQWAYDPHELHDLTTRLRREGLGWFRKFGQGEERLIADRGLYDLVRDRRLHHLGDDTTRVHVRNAGAKVPKEDDNRMRLVKRTPDGLIDAAVALSMACKEATRLNL